ncbi:hypothetical protein VHEMI07658 [[Torrubiella] hemipterigena]|uniref:Uncharacterized protein n=1 Tax=[Torrubiella] hemipterigena TaxID=1531966 RepID=A0A0A1TNB1_9HYPO|nr:hypothetical protein VHEMI07658 [[Torrubiella] hemipterigena]
MGINLLERIQAKLEVFRLEQRYTRRRNRRSTFVSNAIYVDGEYVYQTPNSTGSSADSSSVRVDALHGEQMNLSHSHRNLPTLAPMMEDGSYSPSSSAPSPTERKRLNRFSSIPSFGSAFNKERPEASRRTSTYQW